MKDEETTTGTTGEPAEAAETTGETAEAIGFFEEEILETAEKVIPEALVPLRELMSPRAFFRRTLKLDTFSVMAGDNKYKLEVLSEIYRRRDTAFRYACIYCVAMLVYCMAVGFLSFNMMLVYHSFYFRAFVPQVGFATILPIFLVFFPGLAADFMKQAGVLITTLVFMIFTGVYIVMGYYIFIPFTVIGAYLFLRQNEVLDIYAVLSEEDGFPDFSDFTFEHKNPINYNKETD
jgi:hypothetical protein